MIENKYRHIFCDGSYYLTKNNYIASKAENPDDYNAGAVVKMMIWSMNKFFKEGNQGDHMVLIWDAWSASCNGYYQTNMLKTYKANRKYFTEEDLSDDSIKDLTDEEVKELELNVKRDKIKREAKKIIIDELGKFGIPSVRVWGVEADFISHIASSLLSNDTKKSAFASRDGDWMFLSCTPATDFYKIAIGGAPMSIVTYEDAVKCIPDKIKGKVSLYDFVSFRDSLNGSHNNMSKTRSDRVKIEDIIERLINNEDYTGIDDPDLFRMQYSTFQLHKLIPNFMNIVKDFPQIFTLGQLGTLDEFKEFREKYNVGIGDNYYNNFIKRLDPQFYQGGISWQR